MDELGIFPAGLQERIASDSVTAADAKALAEVCPFVCPVFYLLFILCTAATCCGCVLWLRADVVGKRMP
jgi:hypothetical protein